jgi:hypothetical protein
VHLAAALALARAAKPAHPKACSRARHKHFHPLKSYNSGGLQMRVFFPIAAAMCMAGCSSSPVAGNAEPSRVSADAGAITDERFEAVRKIFEQQGARVERDPSARNTVRIYLPVRTAITMTESQAKQIAGMARSRLGDKAIVYVKNEAGDTLGKATPW